MSFKGTLTNLNQALSSLVYRGNPNFTGNDSITLTVNDRGNTGSGGALSDTDAIAITVAPDVGGILLKEENIFAQTYQKTIQIPASSSILSFTYSDLNFAQTDLDSINDAFEVSLLDETGNSLVHTIAPQRDSFFNITEGLAAVTAAGTSYDPTTQTITVNLVAVAPGTPVQLVFRLVNNDSDTTSYVRIQEISLTDAPAGTQPPVDTTSSTDSGTTLGTSLNLSNLIDVTPSLQAQYQRTTFNDETRLLYAETAIKNIGSYSVNEPLLVSVRNLSDSTVQLRNTNGITPDGLFYYDFSDLVVEGKLDPNEVSQTGNLVFYNPNQVQFTYDVVVLSVLNRDPVIQTQPDTEIIGGQAYQYDVDAIDPDDDTLTYQLLVAPDGVTINETTGIINWTTTNTNIGNHVIQI